jgi:hypothetical protein
LWGAALRSVGEHLALIAGGLHGLDGSRAAPGEGLATSSGPAAAR